MIWNLTCAFEYRGHEEGEIICCGGFGHNVGHHLRSLTDEGRVQNYLARATPEQLAKAQEALLVLGIEVLDPPNNDLPEEYPERDEEQEDYCSREYDDYSHDPPEWYPEEDEEQEDDWEYDDDEGQVDSLLTFGISSLRTSEPESQFGLRDGVEKKK